MKSWELDTLLEYLECHVRSVINEHKEPNKENEALTENTRFHLKCFIAELIEIEDE